MAGFFAQSLGPGGSIKSEGVNVPVHIKPAYGSVKEVEDQIIFSDPDGNMIRLRDIAKVVREYPADNNHISYNGDPCLVLSVEMREHFNIVKFGKEVNKVINNYQRTSLPDDVTISTIIDQSEVVGVRLYHSSAIFLWPSWWLFWL
jgi:multidrug efflux pump subunit AcrB